MKHLLTLLIVLVSVCLLKAQDTKQELSTTQDAPIKKVDKMPIFPGCEDISDYAERKRCGDQKMLQFVYKNLSYPNEARNLGVQGMGVVRFVVSEEGKVKDVEVLRNLGFGVKESMENVIMKMKRSITWEPGQQEGEPVDVYYTLPLKYKLEGGGGRRYDYAFYHSPNFLSNFDGILFIDEEEISRKEFLEYKGRFRSVHIIENSEEYPEGAAQFASEQ